MGKAPAFQFYVMDWLSDPQLKMASHSTKGIWIDFLCFMWRSPIKGKIDGTMEQLQKLVGANDTDFNTFINDIKTLKIGDVTESNKIVTLCNRRMYRDWKEKENTRLRVKRYRAKRECNGGVTVPSSSSSSSSVLEPSKEGHFSPPSKHEIDNASSVKLIQDIEAISKELYDKKIFLKVNAWINQMRKQHKNDRAIIHTLLRCLMKPPKNSAWAYCTKIIQVEDGNFNERDNSRTA